MATLKGRGIRWGANGVTFTAGIVTSTYPGSFQNINMTRTADKAELRDGKGDVIGEIFHNFRKTVSITVIPHSDSSSPTIAEGRTSLEQHMLSPGTKVTVADSEESSAGAMPWATGSYSNWIVDEATMTMTNTGIPAIDLNMHQYEHADLATTTT